MLSLDELLGIPKTSQPLRTADRKRRTERLEKQAEQLLRDAEAQRSDIYRAFGEKYWSDPVGFAHDCIRWKPKQGLTPYQAEIIGNIPIKERVCVRGPHGLGKSCLCSISILWFCLTRDALGVDWKCVTTASVGTQLKRFLWPEIKRWAKDLRFDIIGRPPFNERAELLTMALALQHGSAFAVSPSEPAKLEGAHADHLFYCFDEAKAIEPAIFDAAEGAFSGASAEFGRYAFALCISTPGDPVGPFHDIQTEKEGYEDWWPRHVRMEEAMAAGRITEKWRRQMGKRWGESSALYKQKVMGLFCSSDEDSIIPMDWIELAQLRSLEIDEELAGLARAA